MYKTIGLYKEIEDMEGFEHFYVNEFVPEMLKLPGVIKIRVTRLFPSQLSESALEQNNEPVYFLLSETYFESPQALQNILQSPEGMKVASMLVEQASDFMTAYIGKEEIYSNEEISTH